MQTRILSICGTSEPDSRLEQMLEIAGRAALRAGAELRRLHLGELDLPVMKLEDPAQLQHAGVIKLREATSWCQGLLIGTPEYHGTMSGALKNAFDFLYGELAGKFAAVVASTGGGSGDLSITTVKRTVAWCHGFTLPFHAAAPRTAFGEGGLSDPKIEDRLERIGYDINRYAAVLSQSWAEAQLQAGSAAGVAGLHAGMDPTA